MAGRKKNGKPDENGPDKPAPPPGLPSLDVLVNTPQFVDEHDAFLQELMASTRFFARDCFDRVDEEILPLKRAQMAKFGVDLTLGYAKLVRFLDERHK